MSRSAGVADARLVPVAVGSWSVAAALQTSAADAAGRVTGRGVDGVAVAVAVAGLLAAGLVPAAPAVLRGWRRPAGRGRPGGGPDADRTSIGTGPLSAVGRPTRWSVLSFLVGVIASAIVTGYHFTVSDRGPLAELAAHDAVVGVQAVVADDPRALRSVGPQRGGFLVPVSVVAVTAGGRRISVGGRLLIIAPSPSPSPSPSPGPGAGPGPWSALLPGQRLEVTGRLSPPRGGDLLTAVLSARGEPRLLGRPPWHQRAAGRLRDGLRRACDGLPPGPRGLLPGLVVGDTSRLLPEVAADFTVVGMTHLTAVSGSNVAIVIGAVLLLTRSARAGPRTTAVLGGMALVGFVVLARPSPSVLRAAGMGVLALLALASGRPRTALPALAATVAALVLIDPALAVSAGFALSAVATGGLVMLAPGWAAALRRRGVPAGLAEALAVPAAAQLVCGPIIALVSGGVALVAVPANLLAEPAVAPATVAGVVAAAVSPVSPRLARWCAWIGGWPARWLVRVAQLFAGLPAGTLPWPSGWVGAVLLAASSVALVAAIRRPRLRRAVTAIVVAAVLVVLPIRVLAPGWPPPDWIVVACDVGQGDAVVLAAGGSAAVVVDSGPEPVAIDRCLSGLGVRSIPLAVITHNHSDHTGGLSGLSGLSGRLRRPIGALGYWAAPDRRTAAVVTAAPLDLRAGMTMTIGPLRLRVLGPVRDFHGTRSDPNNDSVVLMAETSGLTVLLAGDVEAEAQAALLADGVDLHADVLKVPHHGSPYSLPGFLAAVRARIALVSVGAGNRYGHPDAGVIARLRGGGASVARTDAAGDIAVIRTPAGPAVVARGSPYGRGRMAA
jgi:competence protein ComEC